MTSHKSFLENGGVVTIKDKDRTCQTRSTTPTSTTKGSTARTSLCRSPGTTQVRPTASTRSRRSSSLSTPLSRTLSEPPPPSLTRAVSIHKSLYLNRWTLSICHTELKVGRGGCGRHGGLGLADVADLQMQGTCRCSGPVDLWMRGTWWTVDTIKDPGVWKGRVGCFVVT